jgi:SAM-dependent methyltransferase
MAADALASGDAARIKGLYTQLGRDWWETTSNGAVTDGVPVLSLPETAPVVVSCVGAADGLVLDAGCGPNPSVSIALASSGRRQVVAMDLGWGTVRVAQEIAARNGVALLGLAADVERLPFRGGAFDVVVCDDTIEHVPDDRQAVSELCRVVRPAGRLVLATPNRHNALILKQRALDWLRRRAKPRETYFVSPSHLREYTWPEFERLIRSHVAVRRRAPVGWSGSKKRGVANQLLHLPSAHRLSQMIVVEGTAPGGRHRRSGLGRRSHR